MGGTKVFFMFALALGGLAMYGSWLVRNNKLVGRDNEARVEPRNRPAPGIDAGEGRGFAHIGRNTWILNLRVQKTASSSAEVFLKQWLKKRRGVNCELDHSTCKTVHEDDADNTWHWDRQTPPCTCRRMEETIVARPPECRAINGLHADFVDLTRWFLRGGTCEQVGNADIGTARNHAVVTFVREPLHRMFSEFAMLRAQIGKGSTKKYPLLKGWDYGCNATTFDEFTREEDCRMGSSNRQTRMIAGHGSNVRWQDVYGAPEEMLDAAKFNLKHSIHFGITEHWEESVSLLDYALSGGKGNNTDGEKSAWAGEIWKRKSSIKRANKAILFDAQPASTKNRAVQLSSLDAELYRYAVDLFWERYCDVFHGRDQRCA